MLPVENSIGNHKKNNCSYDGITTIDIIYSSIGNGKKQIMLMGREEEDDQIFASLETESNITLSLRS